MPHSHLSEQQLFDKFASFPRPRYPFPDMVSPAMEELVQEYYGWIEQDYQFHTPQARERHKSHRLSDFAARTMPHLSLAELRPLARYASTGAMMDDYYDRTGTDDWATIRARIMALLTGEADRDPGPGIEHQFFMMRQDALAIDMPARLHQRYIAALNEVLVGYQDEKRWVAANQPPPLPVYFSVREPTSGVIPFAYYVAMQKDFRELPDDVLDHWVMRRLRQLSARMVGMHNDLISLPKELARDGDVINIVMCIQRDQHLSIEDAYHRSLALHDSYLEQFQVLHQNLPDFGRWQALADDYVLHLGIMVQGLLTYHLTTTRYQPDSYVEPEYHSTTFTWT